MTQQPLPLEARKERDAGIARTTSKNSEWMSLALDLLRKAKGYFPNGATGEMMRLHLTQHGLAQPTSQNAWGALTSHAVKAGILKDSGRVMQMTTKKSHARRTPVWEFV
jgi:hypothetical protein